jgi:transcriptional regulator with XRE-family HTH domain
MTQAEFAKAIGVSRAGYAWWKHIDPEQRTRPRLDQIKSIAELTNTPLQWLVDDESDVNDLIRFKGKELAERAAERAVSLDSGNFQAAQVAMQRKEHTFWAAVEYKATEEREHLATAFNRALAPAPIEVTADYLHGNDLVLWCASMDKLTEKLAMAYLCERLSGRTRSKHVLLWSKGPVDLSQAQALISDMKISRVESPDQAAAYLRNL